MIPPSLREGEQSRAEQRVFDALRDRLDSSFTVLHGVEWAGSGDRAGTQGECDFIVLHPQRGALVIEVKGGSVRVDGGAWFSAGGDGDHAIQDPFLQARRNRFALADVVSRAYNAVAQAVWGYAVWFPDMRADGAMAPDADPAFTFDYTTIDDPTPALESAFAYWASQPGIRAPLDVDRVLAVLAPQRTFRAPLAVAMQQEATESRILTEQQYGVLHMIAGRKQTAISGPAGSGKTMLALRQCQISSDAGHAVLYVCFNKRLAAWMAKETARLPGVQARTFHRIVDEQAAIHHVQVPADRDTAFWEERAADILFDIAAERGPSYDVLIVDEGQDFQSSWLTALRAMLRPDGREVVFFDDNQRLYERDAIRELAEGALTLPYNCRTTQAIHRELQPYHTGDMALPTGPPGRQPERIRVTSDANEEREVRRTLHQLVKVEDIALNRIVILTPRHEQSHWREGDRLGNFTLTWNDDRDESSQVLCSSIQAFKGMESDVVLVTEMSKAPLERAQQLWYTACSRARHHLVIYEMQLALPEAD